MLSAIKRGAVLGALLAVAVTGLAGGPALAGSWKFEIINKGNQPVTSFRTQEDGKWSENWLRGQAIRPGDSFDMDFGSDEGDCAVRTRITLADASYFDETIDYCKADVVTLYNDTLTTNE